MDKKKKKRKKKGNWVVQAFVLTFLLSLVISMFSNLAIRNLDVLLAIVVLILVIFVGILFDLIGVAVTIAQEKEFHAMASKRIPGAKQAIALIRDSVKISNICADVIGDICGVLSGSLAALITIKLSEKYGIPTDYQILLSALTASLTVGGKAYGKLIARRNPEDIVFFIAKRMK